MLRTLVVGLGRAGSGLHVPVLCRARAAAGASLFADEPIVAIDPAVRPDGLPPEVVVVPSPAAARALLDPARTVTHVCTPPVARIEVVEELAGLGFRDLIIEKPLAADPVELAAFDALRTRHDLRVIVVAQWLGSALTRRLRALVEGGELGALRTVTFAQHKPRFTRSLATAGHPTAFDIELPHALGVVLALAGPARVVDASGSDLRVGDTVLPRLGGARLRLAHASGVRSDLVSDLSAPIRERRIALGFAHGSATGHYPVAQDDDHARLTVHAPGHSTSEVFPDDSLTGFVCESYRRFLAVKDSLRESDVTMINKCVGDAARSSRPAPFPAIPAGRAPDAARANSVDRSVDVHSADFREGAADSAASDRDLALAFDVVRLLDEAKRHSARRVARGAASVVAPTAPDASAGTPREWVYGDVR